MKLTLDITHPQIADQWHPTKNGDLKPSDFTHGSKAKVWWYKEECGHEWDAVIYSRTGPGNGCPYCSGNKICIDNCLQTKFPEIAQEWDYERNYPLTPYDVMPSSGKKYWWVSKCGHKSWQTTPNKRTRKEGSNCPYCSCHQICLENCLATTHPLIADQWHPTKNGDVTPFDVVAGSKKKYWWYREECKHSWFAPIIKRTKYNRGCHYCANQKVCIENCLQTIFPEVANEWHYEKNYPLTPYDVVAGSSKKYWWYDINCGHEWFTAISHRTGKGKSNCPYCKKSKGEKEINKILQLLNVSFDGQHRIDACRNILPLPFDFGLFNNKNLIGLIEYQGEQHYNLFVWDNYSEDALKLRQYHDKIKFDFCNINKIPLLIVPYWDKKLLPIIIPKFIEDIGCISC